MISDLDEKATIQDVYKKIDEAPESIQKIVEPFMDIEKIKNIAFTVAIILILSAIFTYVESISMTIVSNGFAKGLRSRISKKINKLPLSYFDRNQTGDILSRVTKATPKIADYHFTTIDPNLGVVKTEYGDSFVLADIPGIIEGASEGIGLGTQFLRHVERTRLLLHVIDIAGTEGRNPIDDFNKINDELKKYSEKLSTRKQIIVANKIDSMQDDSDLKEIEKIAKQKDIEIYKISAVTGEGLNELFNHVAKIIKTLPKEEVVDVEDRIVYTLDDDADEFTIDIIDGEFIVEGAAVERLMGRVNIGDNESYHYMEKMLKKLGIEDALREKGVKEGDTVKLLEWVFEWYE